MQQHPLARCAQAILQEQHAADQDDVDCQHSQESRRQAADQLLNQGTSFMLTTVLILLVLYGIGRLFDRPLEPRKPYGYGDSPLEAWQSAQKASNRWPWK